MTEESSCLRFLDVPAEASDPEHSRFVVLPVPLERTVSYGKGTRLGPDAIIRASHQVEMYDEELRCEPWKRGIHTQPPVEVRGPLDEVMGGLSERIRPFVGRGQFVITLGGEHSLSVGAFEGVKAELGDVSVLQIDAHADLRDSYEGTPLSHACTAARLSEKAKKVVQVGIRSVSEDECDRCNAGNVSTFLMQENRDVEALTPRVIDALKDPVYITIDLDGFDPSVIPGVGTPVPGGLGWYDMLYLLRKVIQWRKVVAADVVELSPIRGEIRSDFAAARLVYRLMGYVAEKDGSR